MDERMVAVAMLDTQFAIDNVRTSGWKTGRWKPLPCLPSGKARRKILTDTGGPLLSGWNCVAIGSGVMAGFAPALRWCRARDLRGVVYPFRLRLCGR